jgi:hypothetical protein
MSMPAKAIHNTADFEQFKKSAAFIDLSDFVKRCAEAAVGTQNISDVPLVEFPAIAKFVELMERLSVLVDETPPIKQPMRFGNKAFRSWHAEMVKIAGQSIEELASQLEITDLDKELKPYVAEMFGNPTRIDYGTGHELNFAVCFLVLTKMGALADTKEALAVVVTKAFPSYIRTMRRLQTEYMLEPAGSHGVWGLDDYHCLLFLWGAAQLSGQKDLRPADIHNPEVLREHAAEYTYLEGIEFIKRIKASAPFAETSPMLNDISGLHDWAKICSGLMRLFQAEVLQKFPVIQHLLFGKVLQCTWTSTGGGSGGIGFPGAVTAAPWATGAVFVRSRGGSPSVHSAGHSNASSAAATPSKAVSALTAESVDAAEAPHHTAVTNNGKDGTTLQTIEEASPGGKK